MIDLILNIINTKTKKIITYEAYLDENSSGEVIIKDEQKTHKFNNLIDIIEGGEDEYTLEVVYGDKIQFVKYELEYNCIVISSDAQKRLLSNSKINKKYKLKKTINNYSK